MAHADTETKKRDLEPPHTVCPSVSMDNDQLIVVAACRSLEQDNRFPRRYDSAIGDK